MNLPELPPPEPSWTRNLMLGSGQYFRNEYMRVRDAPHPARRTIRHMSLIILAVSFAFSMLSVWLG